MGSVKRDNDSKLSPLLDKVSRLCTGESVKIAKSSFLSRIKLFEPIGSSPSILANLLKASIA